MTGSPTVHPSIVSGYGLVDAPFDVVVERFGSYVRGDQSQARVVRTETNVAGALDYLSIRTFPATRFVLLDLGAWTAVVTNNRTGSDFDDHQYWAARSIGTRTIRVVDSRARWWRRGQQRHRIAYEARIFQLCAEDGSNLRSITCANDGGRWVFEATGQPLPFEPSFDTAAPRTQDRFTREHLHALLQAAGPGPLTAERLLAVPRCALIAERLIDEAWREQVEAYACSLEDADDPAFGYFVTGMSYVPHIATHAASVIAAFERAIEINPAYEPRVRTHLRQARRHAR